MKAYSRHSERPTLKRFKQTHAYEHEGRGAMVAGWPIKPQRKRAKVNSGHSPVIRDTSFPLSHGYTSQD